MITGDFNAKVGEGVQHEDETRAISSHGLGSRNERGSILVDFCLANRLTITNTIFQQHLRRKYTWISPNGCVRNQIDYILISIRWKSSIKIAKTLPGADIGSDHQLLTPDCTIALIPHASKILLHIINKRFRPHIECELPAEQAGFMKGHGTRDQITNISHIMEKCFEFQQKIFLFHWLFKGLWLCDLFGIMDSTAGDGNPFSPDTLNSQSIWRPSCMCSNRERK